MSTLSDFGVPIGGGGLLRWVLEPQAHVGLWVALVEGKIVCMQTLEHVEKYRDGICPHATIVQITEDNKNDLVWAEPGTKERYGRDDKGNFYANVPDDSLHWNTNDQNS